MKKWKRMKKRFLLYVPLLALVWCCSPEALDPVLPEQEITDPSGDDEEGQDPSGNNGQGEGGEGQIPSPSVTRYTDSNGDVAYIPANFSVSGKQGERVIRSGLVVIGPDGSEYVWVPTKATPLKMRDFGSYFSGSGSLSGYSDETSLASYQAMAQSVATYGGFYIGRYEASFCERTAHSHQSQ